MSKKWLALYFFLLLIDHSAPAQSRREDIYTDYVLFGKRQRLRKDLLENTLGRTFTQAVNEDNEHRFESACSAISQFHIKDQIVRAGLNKLFEKYDSLQYDTKRALLEATYAVFPLEYQREIEKICQKETAPKLFAITAVYLARIDRSIDKINSLKIKMVEQFPDYDSADLLVELSRYRDRLSGSGNTMPSLKQLMLYHKLMGNKVIYSFQRENRDYPGIAIVQDAKGDIARRSDGRILVFEQLARSGSSLPYFLTNGNTPQGIFRITGTGVANNHFIEPTPNLQMIMPFEDSLAKFFNGKWDSSIAPMQAYEALWPLSWRNYTPITEAYYAGKIGRTEIIAHGTTLDPEYFKDEPFYPLTPTLGCLCAREIWNTTTGRLLVSEQYNLYSTFLASPGAKGYLIVINLGEENRPVTREEVEREMMR